MLSGRDTDNESRELPNTFEKTLDRQGVSNCSMQIVPGDVDIVSGESYKSIQNRNGISPPTCTPMTEQGQENHLERAGNFEH